MSEEKQLKPLAVIYFSPRTGRAMKDLANRVRNSENGGNANLVYSHMFKDEGDVRKEADAVILQKTAPRAAMIASMYAQFGKEGVEIHWVDSAGDFIEPDEGTDASEQEKDETPTPADLPGSTSAATDAGSTEAAVTPDVGASYSESEGLRFEFDADLPGDSESDSEAGTTSDNGSAREL